MQTRDADHPANLRKAGLTRREILKLSGMAAAGATLPSLSGCRGGGPAGVSDTACLANIPRTEPKVDVFGPSRIGKIRVKNRIVRSATTINDIDERGLPRPGLVRTYRELAEGGVGCVITGMMDGGMLLNGFRYRDENAPDFRKVPDLFHAHDIPVVQQISHEGRQETFDTLKDPYVTQLSAAAIESLIDRYVDATEKCRDLGFDGVQMHCAHGYLLSEFLAPSLNERTDEWGGSTEKRFKAVGEIFRRARRRVGPDFPLWAKINAYDFQEGGMRVEEAVKIAGMLQEAGCDCIEVSSGLGVDGFATIRVREVPTEAILEWSSAMEDKRDLTKKVMSWVLPFMIKTYGPLGSYNVCQAKPIKESVDIPVIVVGGLRNREDMNNVFRLGAADFVSLGRPLLTEPGFVNKLKRDGTHRSPCIECGYCLVSLPSRPAECYMGTLPS